MFELKPLDRHGLAGLVMTSLRGGIAAAAIQSSSGNFLSNQ
jgi:hypothetical protein